MNGISCALPVAASHHGSVSGPGQRCAVDDGLHVGAEVGMYQPIACSRDQAPRYAGLVCNQLAAQVLYRFADDLELANDCALRLAVCHETGATLGGVALDFSNCAQHVTQEEPVAIVQIGRASARMRCFNCGSSSRSVQRSTLTPNESSISSCRPTMCSNEVPIGRSTSRSMSLPSWSCPRATDPKTRTRLAPRAAAKASTSSRLAASAWDGRMRRFWQGSVLTERRCAPHHADSKGAQPLQLLADEVIE